MLQFFVSVFFFWWKCCMQSSNNYRPDQTDLNNYQLTEPSVFKCQKICFISRKFCCYLHLIKFMRCCCCCFTLLLLLLVLIILMVSLTFRFSFSVLPKVCINLSCLGCKNMAGRPIGQSVNWSLYHRWEKKNRKKLVKTTFVFRLFMFIFSAYGGGWMVVSCCHMFHID